MVHKPNLDIERALVALGELLAAEVVGVKGGANTTTVDATV